jgi:hypothetical protein
VAGPTDTRKLPTQLAIDGRTADGTFSIRGAANFFNWARGQAAGGFQAAALDEGLVWSPALALTVNLDNVGYAALGRMVPNPSLIPAGGTLSGRIDVALDGSRVECRSALVLQNVSYTPNLDSLAVRGRADALSQELRAFRANGPVAVGCEGSADDERYRLVQAVQVGVTEQAVRQASPIVRQTAAFDRQVAAGTLTEAGIATVSDALGREIGAAATAAFGSQLGGAVSQSLTGAPSGTTQPGKSAGAAPGNPIGRGLKSAGRGIKRLFGGGNKDKKPGG